MCFLCFKFDPTSVLSSLRTYLCEASLFHITSQLVRTSDFNNIDPSVAKIIWNPRRLQMRSKIPFGFKRVVHKWLAFLWGWRWELFENSTQVLKHKTGGSCCRGGVGVGGSKNSRYKTGLTESQGTLIRSPFPSKSLLLCVTPFYNEFQPMRR